MRRPRIRQAPRVLAWLITSLLFLAIGGPLSLYSPLSGLTAIGLATLFRLLWTQGNLSEAISPWLLVIATVIASMGIPSPG